MIQYPLHGSYSPSQLIMSGSFQLNGDQAPSVLRDGTKVSSAQKMFTVSRASEGLYTVTFNDGYPIPERPFLHPSIEQATDAVTVCIVEVVKNSWSKSTRSFQLLVRDLSDGTASDGNAGDRVTFLIIGAIDSVGVDPA